MGTREKFEDRIEKKEAEIREHELAIREGRAYIQALQDAIKFLPREDSNGDAVEVDLRAGSKTAKARDFIKQHGSPIHVGKILDGLGFENTKETRASLAGSMGSYARKGQIFKNFGSNVFGLIDMQSSNSAPSEDENLFGGNGVGK